MNESATAYLGGEHYYLSTACFHANHGYCQGEAGERGPKVPARCKFCPAPCICPCHADQSAEDALD